MSDLSAPLIRRGARLKGKVGTKAPPRWRLPVARLAFVAMLLILGAVVGRIMLVDDPRGGRPIAEVAINDNRAVNTVAGDVSTEAPKRAVITAEAEHGAPGSPSIITLSADELNTHGAASITVVGDEPDTSGNLPDLVEETSHGAIPRISGTGETPFAAYSRPSVSAESANGKPLIAIIVTGLGLNVAGTLSAVEKLPETVTLAFAPYGRSLDRTVGAARAEGHELFLEVPLEPFDYPDNDPGPDTLLTGQNPRDNMERLFTVMSKFGGYAGLINNMGARFTASGADFGPMMEELGARGLGYLDDGSSNRSLAPQLAKANGVPFAGADLQLDSNPTRASILEQLAVLEARARQQGSAIAVVSALPVSIDTVAEWANGLEAKGLLLVPASALMKP